ncbi:hypothetical protein J6590_047091 [Homalodisca vitripennis]|nr:hypothetical protein J6590_047091 [Homalodisca vitripennis]
MSMNQVRFVNRITDYSTTERVETTAAATILSTHVHESGSNKLALTEIKKNEPFPRFTQTAVLHASGKKAKLGEVGKWIIEDGENVPLDVKQAFLLPAWYDEKKFKRGQKYFADNYFSLFVAKLCGLLVVLAVPSILRVLVLTGQSSHPVSAFRRYLDTLSHMLEWYEGDVMNPNSSIVSQFYLILSHMLEWYEVDVKNSNSGIVSQLCLILSHVLRWYEEDVMNPNSRASKSLLNIRSRHCHATRRATKAGFSNISQRDMALTQFGFMGFAVLRPKELGLTGSQEDLEGFLHFWRVIGHLLGIKEQYNLCQGDVETTRAACQAMLDRVFNVGLRQPSADFQHMSRALLEGMWALVPFINPEAFLSFTLLLCGIDTFQLSKFYSRTLFHLQVFVQAVILNSVIGFIVRPILNFNMWLSIFITQRFPYLAFLAFGRSITPPEQFTIKSSLVSEN